LFVFNFQSTIFIAKLYSVIYQGMRGFEKEWGTDKLLNVPPDHDGIITKEVIETLICIEENYYKIKY
jgi:hypothetical protein